MRSKNLIATEAIVQIKALTKVKQIKAFIKKETRKTVLDCAICRISKYKIAKKSRKLLKMK